MQLFTYAWCWHGNRSREYGFECYESDVKNRWDLIINV